jgi:hypothetical protein
MRRSSRKALSRRSRCTSCLAALAGSNSALWVRATDAPHRALYVSLAGCFCSQMRSTRHGLQCVYVQHVTLLRVKVSKRLTSHRLYRRAD